MGDASTSKGQDRTLVTLLCAVTITVLAVVFYVVVGINDMLGDSGRSYQTSAVPMVLIGVFRYACAYLAFHTIVFWMIRSPELSLIHI
mgnify:CR=1 FL=1